ncbi:hypothetical protein BD779DRAFT_1661040 [Infundibulicybe gibba]|nr:hypothetical protein BD779DRAFT_1661040 [Infundibulicybe gibba]
MDDDNSTTTRLLTLLNVSATKSGKRKWITEEHPQSEKLNKRKSVKIQDETAAQPTTVSNTAPAEQHDDEPEDSTDRYEHHFGPKSASVSEKIKTLVDQLAWSSSKEELGKLGSAILSIPNSGESYISCKPEIDILNRLKEPFKSRQATKPNDHVELQNTLLSTLSSRRDLYMPSVNQGSRASIQEAVTLHALNHITKKRRRVLKNNERLANAAKTNPNDPPPEDVQDQGFTRPSVLILLPFRSSALDWFGALSSHTPSSSFQIENHSRFLAEYGLPPGFVDKLAAAEPGTYPQDHVETFKGNIDDNFRIGIKMTRKSVKFPLGLRRSIEKEKNADYLSSIEMLIIDQMDALTMQNWEHIKFVFASLNLLPKESRNTDFSRIKPWYLEGYAAYLRQTILLSAFETPETRALFNTSLKNGAGKIRTEKRWPPIEIPEGIAPNFISFGCSSPKDEAEKRFHHFASQLLPEVLKSAVQSANTVIFIPSSFDFIRVQNYFRKQAGVTYTVLSEYSSNQEISRARQAFFTNQKSFLLISERFSLL